jgi:hypothetical protein
MHISRRKFIELAASFGASLAFGSEPWECNEKEIER